MSRQDHTSKPSQSAGQPQERRTRPMEIQRSEQEQPELSWIALEDPDQSFLLHEDDYILDSHFNPEFDIWEVLIRLEPAESDE